MKSSKFFLNINWRIRVKNPVFWGQLLASILLPILTYFGLNFQDLTTWKIVGELLVKATSNPFVLGTIVVSVINTINDPTTTGLTDSARSLNYLEPNDVKLK